MSYDIRMVDIENGETLHMDAEHYITGGTYAHGGTTEVWLNITYNYGKFFYETIDAERGIRALYGKTGCEALPILQKAIAQLGDDGSSDYWEATEGNAKKALKGLVVFAALFPNGVFVGD